MDWDKIVGQTHLKSLLKNSVEDRRVGHAQLFLGKDGYGTFALALAFAQELLSRENELARSKVGSLNHLDLHITFPVYKSNRSGLTAPFFDQFREMMLANPYSNSEDWNVRLESENKQLTIYADEIDEINKKFSLKSFEGGSKILIVWHADKMNAEAANKFLKFLEEPPKNTYIILTADDALSMLDTILSRTQLVEVPRLKNEEMLAALQEKNRDRTIDYNSILFRAQGNWNTAMQLLQFETLNGDSEELFILWVCEAFMVKKKPEFLKNIVLWARQIAAWNKEKQLSFVAYCSEMFRLALLQNYAGETLVYNKITRDGFKWETFSSYINGANIEAILNELSEADYHLERNGNPRIIWTDLGIKLSRYLHKKA